MASVRTRSRDEDDDKDEDEQWMTYTFGGNNGGNQLAMLAQEAWSTTEMAVRVYAYDTL